MRLRRLQAFAEVACRTKSRTLITTREWQEDLLLLDGLRAAGWQTQSEFETGPQRFDYVLYQLTPPVPCQ